MINVRWPSSARQAPRLMHVVVLPTPPFWLATAITRGRGRPVGSEPTAIASSGTVIEELSVVRQRTGPGPRAPSLTREAHRGQASKRHALDVSRESTPGAGSQG